MGSTENSGLSAESKVGPTKKMLVAFDPAFPNASSSDFLLPWIEAGHVALRGTRSGAVVAFGLVVYTGRPIAGGDLLAKAVDARWPMESFDEVKSMLEAYLLQVKSLVVGNIVRAGGGLDDWKLDVVAKSPSSFKS